MLGPALRNCITCGMYTSRDTFLLTKYLLLTSARAPGNTRARSSWETSLTTSATGQLALTLTLTLTLALALVALALALALTPTASFVTVASCSTWSRS